MPRSYHGDKFWAAQETAEVPVVRCHGTIRSTGDQCRAEAIDATNFCGKHGAYLPNIRKAAAERVLYTAEMAVERLIEFMNDPAVPAQVRAKVAQDLLDRAGLAAAQTHRLVVAEADPVEALFANLAAQPDVFERPPALEAKVVVPDPAQAAQDAYEQEQQPLLDATLEGREPRALPAGPSSPVAADRTAPPTRRAPAAVSRANTPRHIREALARRGDR